MNPIAVHGSRERALERGVEDLGDAELLALLLGHGGRGTPAPAVASAVLTHAGGLAGLARVGTAALASTRQVGIVRALRIAAAIELGRRTHQATRAPRPGLACAADIAEYLAPRIAGLAHEEMWVVSLDGRNRLRGARRVAQGGLHGCAVAARDILRAALGDAASAFVLVHNHPSGDPRPSPEDLVMTAAVARAAAVVGVPLVDHVVVSEGGHASMLELGALDVG